MLPRLVHHAYSKHAEVTVPFRQARFLSAVDFVQAGRFRVFRRKGTEK